MLSRKNLLKVAIAILFVFGIACFFITGDITRLWEILSSKDLLKKTIESYGVLAPFIYTFVQMLQVFIAPVPGEITGIVGGYIFGLWKGFFLSSAALGIGSLINFITARYFAKDLTRKLIPESYLKKFDHFFNEEGKLFILALFIFPGFPKDYFCLFLGLTNMDMRLFIIFSTLGRMPGTFLLSLQGSLLYENEYLLTIILAIISGIISLILIMFRKSLYSKVKRFI